MPDLTIDDVASNDGTLIDEAPTESHALATADSEPEPGPVGHAQVEHSETEARDLGWNDLPEKVPKPLVAGLSNEDLWAHVRRFNKVCPTSSETWCL